MRRGRTLLLISLALALAWGLGWLTRRPLLEARSFSHAIYDRDGNLLRLTLSGDEKYRLRSRLGELTPEFKEAVLLHEDRYFYSHFGINPWSLTKAAANTYLRGTRRMGGSTITMQLARLTSSRGSKTLVGKFVQIARAFEIELFHSKDEIFEAYLNLLPYGQNVEGIAAATLIYFGKAPRDLTLGESLTLAVVPQNPSRRALGNDFTSLSLRARSRLFSAWCRRHPEARRDSVDVQLPLITKRIAQLPFRAPHFTDAVLAKTFHQARMETTLDRHVQNVVESKTKAYIAPLKNLGIENAAVLIVDHQNMDVVAMLGSADFFNAEISGQVNGTQAKRSPGSTLKPFVYALALDQGLIHPQTLLKDTPMSFSGFDPENFDKSFSGPVKATEALIRSRNVPAVYLSSLLQQPTFYDFLKSAGVTRLKASNYYGLSLALGGAELTMEEIVRLYGALANRGELRPLRSLKNDPLPEGPRVLSPEAAYLTLDMLRQNPRNDGMLTENWLRDSVPIAWKTGTSQGFRDAWTVGVMGPYIIAVWLGNFDGERNPALIGRDLAAPLFFRIADALKDRAHPYERWLSREGLNLKRIHVCAISGALPGPHCHHIEETWFIPGRSPIATCTIHREILLSADASRRLCDESDPKTKRAVFEFWPSDLLQVFKMAGIARKGPPPFAESCQASATRAFGLPPTILSPKRDVVYSIEDKHEEDANTVPLMAVSDGDVRELSWFVGGEFIGKASPQKPLLWPTRPGRFVVRVVDDLGRFDSRELVVKMSN